MDKLREKFEALTEIAEKLDWCEYCESTDNYHARSAHVDEFEFHTEFVNGAWYAFQEQQKNIDEHNQKLKEFIVELEKTSNDDKNNKIDYWRGFSGCADSSVRVFLRDVGFIN